MAHLPIHRPPRNSDLVGFQAGVIRVLVGDAPSMGLVIKLRKARDVDSAKNNSRPISIQRSIQPSVLAQSTRPPDISESAISRENDRARRDIISDAALAKAIPMGGSYCPFFGGS